ncbi:MAG: MarR family winged helix-turn-helix transcriptional regulator [candidate division KSB1 bacterium]|nr:MarR family winged helix-turn-helix transcriptional regulator [candidate division KSB1 bacterium]MDZ7276157.1 MarR family winged helix-turn-helix transcriptional regulator [candidate division KSB1 bacterium]MDZ7287063.1 MarR family winged helix-turn-helix transcriptional regulator [candidate division KSB1 bacterium]MDZ7297012.1 MarR family winged helix-turn-helix transcriptional regulator [candidate division KSB1 bacterium]MDZ7307518.1 MarR family winged helix-turn-helix transcriptional regu
MAGIFDPAQQHHNPDAKIAAALERLSQAFRVLLWEQNKEHNLSPIQIQFLVFLLHHGKAACTVGLLAREFMLTPATVSDALTTLEGKELVARIRLQSDRRVATLRLTPQGRKVARQLANWAEVVQTAIAGSAPGEKLVVMHFLMRLLARLQHAGVISVARMCITCRFFQAVSTPDTPHYCTLLNQPLRSEQLRLDCPDHEPAAEPA